MYSFLGPHLHTAAGQWVAETYNWKPPVVVSLDHADSVAQIVDHSPSTLIVGRMMGHTPDFEQPMNTEQVAREHVGITLPQANRMGDAYSFWQCCVNEPVIKTADGMRRYAEYTVHVVEMLADEGFTAGVGHFSVGTPEFDLWPQFVPAMRVAKEHGCVLCLHEYDWPTLLDESRWPWWLFRHRLVYDGSPTTIEQWGWHGLPDDLKDMWLVITEAGLDSTVTHPGQPFRGWKEAMPGTVYLAELYQYSQELGKDPYVLGACLWDFGATWQWITAEHWPEIAFVLADEATPVYRFFDNDTDHAENWRRIARDVRDIQLMLSLCH